MKTLFIGEELHKYNSLDELKDILRISNIKLGYNVTLGDNVTIHDDVVIGDNVTF